ncbi:acyl-CoA dehydrogenase family protein [Nocardia alni]|uniref:acyl-CoA dehydrogenase family protein n=1 Tax=Nocardia alni TaxID=2815723 RepID=UPI001C232EEC|nr:acyl-CoA dehydrogenase family protein [Nocardia alni]
MSVPDTDAAEISLLTETLRKTMTTTSGVELDAALTELGWPEMLAMMPDIAVPLVFRLLGETGAHAPVLNDVVLHALDRRIGDTVPIPYADRWLIWGRDGDGGETADPELPLRPAVPGSGESVASHSTEPGPAAAARRALAWWLVGSGHAMLSLARQHALDRTQFGRPVASFQAIRHKLAETLVALEGAEATLTFADDDLGALLAKAAAGRAALLAAKHCQQTLGGIGFTAEHDLQGHIRRVLVLDGLFGSTRELTREAGRRIRDLGSAPRLAQL